MRQGLIILLTYFCLSSVSLSAQTFLFHKGRKEIKIHKGYSATFKTRGAKITGDVDSLNEKEIIIKENSGSVHSINPSDLSFVRECGYYWLLWGASGHLGHHCKRINLKDFKFKFIPKT